MNNLKFLREELKLNMKQTAEALSMPYTTYVSYEKGDREPGSDMLIKIADFYNTTIDFILGISSTKNNPNSLTEKESPEGDPKIKELYNVLEKLSDESLDKLLDYAQMLLLSQSQ